MRSFLIFEIEGRVLPRVVGRSYLAIMKPAFLMPKRAGRKSEIRIGIDPQMFVWRL